VDIAKDQSYVLAVLTRAQLDRAIFPLGDSTKARVRAEAAERGLAVAEKPDSHDICFIADGDTKGFLASRLGAAPGDVVDARTGAKVGTHDGAYAYTIGQRKGLDLRVPAPDGKPRYVLSITPKTNTVTVGSHADLEVDTVTAIRPIWHGDPGATECEVQMRAHGEVVPGVVTVGGGDLTARLRQPARGIAAGQAIVAYRPDPGGDVVLGSATISAGFRGPVPGDSASSGGGPSASSNSGGSARAGRLDSELRGSGARA
jgi:tRNA-specific 2-thiouridylase